MDLLKTVTELLGEYYSEFRRKSIPIPPYAGDKPP
jgi:hypothetical protein